MRSILSIAKRPKAAEAIDRFLVPYLRPRSIGVDFRALEEKGEDFDEEGADGHEAGADYGSVGFNH